MCKPVYAACKKLEDGATGYITKCFTSEDNLFGVLKSLNTALDKMLKVDTKIGMILNGTAR